MEGFPADPEPFRATLLRALELKRLTSELELVLAAEVQITDEGHDNWNGGMDYWGISLRVPLELFVRHEELIGEREENILQTANALWRGQPGERFTSVVVSPVPLTAHGTRQVATGGIEHLPLFWELGRFRLFLTHCASYKV